MVPGGSIGQLEVPSVGAPLCQVLSGSGRGFLGLAIPMGSLQAELGLAGRVLAGPG